MGRQVVPYAAPRSPREDRHAFHALLQHAGVPCGPLNDIAAVVSDPQVVARNMIIDAGEGETGPVLMAGNPVKLSGFEDSDVRAPAPALDADRARILAEFADD